MLSLSGPACLAPAICLGATPVTPPPPTPRSGSGPRPVENRNPQSPLSSRSLSPPSTVSAKPLQALQ
ncbi:unnamed protein product [Gadus morhua 'NCC']